MEVAEDQLGERISQSSVAERESIGGISTSRAGAIDKGRLSEVCGVSPNSIGAVGANGGESDGRIVGGSGGWHAVVDSIEGGRVVADTELRRGVKSDGLSIGD